MAKVSAGQLELGTDTGLSANGRDLEVALAANSGLEFSTGLKVEAAFAGDGLALAAGVLSVNVDDSSIETNADSLRVKASGITDAMTASSYTYADGTRAFTGDQSMGGFKLTSLGTATASGDAVTKAYADAMAVRSGAASGCFLDRESMAFATSRRGIGVEPDCPSTPTTSIVRPVVVSRTIWPTLGSMSFSAAGGRLFNMVMVSRKVRNMR